MIYTNAPLSVPHRNLTYSRVTAGISVESLSLVYSQQNTKGEDRRDTIVTLKL